MRCLLTAAGAALIIGISACGSNYTAPTGSGNPPPAGAIVINIVGINGAMSFSPNPATVPPGQMVVWYNRDTVTHHVVLDDGRLDAGNVAPGAYTVAMTLNTPGPYHCTIHPEMVGVYGCPVSGLAMPGCTAGTSICERSPAEAFCEISLPAPVREALRLAREAHPQHRLRCLAFHSDENGREVAHLGLTSAAGLRPKDVMVLAVAVTETVSDDVRTVSHTLVIRVEAGVEPNVRLVL